MLFVPTALDADGVAQLVAVGTPNANLKAQAYSTTGKAIKSETSASTDGQNGGFRFKAATGYLLLTDATAALPSPVFYQEGVALDATGAVCYTTDAFNALDAAYVGGGLAVTLNGKIYASIS